MPALDRPNDDCRYDPSESSRVIDMGRGVVAAGMTTFVGLRPNYGVSTNHEIAFNTRNGVRKTRDCVI